MEEPGPGGDLQRCEGKWDFFPLGRAGPNAPCSVAAATFSLTLYLLNVQVRRWFFFGRVCAASESVQNNCHTHDLSEDGEGERGEDSA